LFNNGIVIKKKTLSQFTRYYLRWGRNIPFASMMLCFQNFIDKSTDKQKEKFLKHRTVCRININEIVRLYNIFKNNNINLSELIVN